MPGRLAARLVLTSVSLYLDSLLVLSHDRGMTKTKAIPSRPATTSDGRKVRLATPVPTGRILPCPGEAHRNPYIDNCMVCMPEWGTVAERKVDVDAALAAGIAVAFGDIPRERSAEFRGVSLAQVTCRTRGGGSVSLFAVLPQGKKKIARGA